jgi:hypothetical protein
LRDAWTQRRQGRWIDRDFDATRDARLTLNKPGAFEVEHHLVNGRRGDLEMPLQVGLGRRAAEDERIGVNEGEVLPLLFCEAAWRRIEQRQQLAGEIAAWRGRRRASGARIKWMFTTHRARDKLARAYPAPGKES